MYKNILISSYVYVLQPKELVNLLFKIFTYRKIQNDGKIIGVVITPQSPSPSPPFHIPCNVLIYLYKL